MKNKRFDGSAIAIVLVIIGILFSACSAGNSDPSNENTTKPSSTINESSTEPSSTESNSTESSSTEPTSTINESSTEPSKISNEDQIFTERATSEIYTNPHDIPGSLFNIWDCFIAADPEKDPGSVELFGSYDCTPGYVYFAKEVYGEIKPLFEKKCKRGFIAELIDKIYVVTEDNEVVKITKKDEKNKTVYKPQYGTIDVMSFDSAWSRYMFFSDGDYIIRLDPTNDECTVMTKSDNIIKTIWGGSGEFDKIGEFYCEKCNEEYVVWEDVDENFYWYHPETNQNELVDFQDLYVGHPA